MRKGEQTRQEIIRKAAPIFNQRGYDGAALSDLMKATGLEKGGIYRHFDSKQQLAAEAFDYAWRETFDARIHDLDTVSNTVDRLKQLVANFVERRGIIPGGCPLLNTAIDTDDGNSVLRERARKALRGWRSYVISIVSAGIKAREIRPRVDAKKVAPSSFLPSRVQSCSTALNELRRRCAPSRPISTTISKLRCEFPLSDQWRRSLASLGALAFQGHASRGRLGN